MNLQTPQLFCPPQNGEIIPHNEKLYFIGQKIGQGNFGAVYDVIANALRRHTEHRTKTALNFWRGISAASK